MSLYPSRGLTLTGFEIKSSRADWRNEKKNPEKAEEIARFCDFWIVVAGHEEVIPVEEVPNAWGLLVPGKEGKTLVLKKAPEKLEAQQITRNFLAGLLRKAAERVVPKDEVQAKINAEVERRIASNYNTAGDELIRYKLAHEKLIENVRSFEARSGLTVRVEDWSMRGDLRPHIAFSMSGGIGRFQKELHDLAKTADRIASTIRKEVESESLDPDFSI